MNDWLTKGVLFPNLHPELKFSCLGSDPITAHKVTAIQGIPRHQHTNLSQNALLIARKSRDQTVLQTWGWQDCMISPYLQCDGNSSTWACMNLWHEVTGPILSPTFGKNKNIKPENFNLWPTLGDKSRSVADSAFKSQIFRYWLDWVLDAPTEDTGCVHIVHFCLHVDHVAKITINKALTTACIDDELLRSLHQEDTCVSSYDLNVLSYSLNPRAYQVGYVL